MNDKEFLLLAAKACGYTVHSSDERATGIYIVVDRQISYWSPLTDDGDALRLAADLRLKVLPGKHKGDGCTVESQRPGIPGCTTFRDDKREQMRLAIVLVAAEIGKAMP